MTQSLLKELRKAAPKIGQKNLAQLLFLIALLLYTVSFPLLPRLHSNSESVLLILFFGFVFVYPGHYRTRQAVLGDPVFKIMITMLFFLLLAQVWYQFSRPEYIDASLRDARYYMKPIMVVVIAFSLHQTSHHSRWWFLIAGLAGFLIYLITSTHFKEWENALNGSRVDFGIHNSQHAAMFFGSVLVGTLIFLPRVYRHNSGIYKLITSTAMVGLLCLAIFGVLVTQTRAVWLGLLAALCLAFILIPYLISRMGDLRHRIRDNLLGYPALLILVLSTVFLGLNADKIIKNRIDNEATSLERINKAIQLDYSPQSSSTIRIASWAAASQWISERPFLGWGPDATESLIDKSPHFSNAFKDKFGHVHNSFLESLLANGLVGSTLMAALIIWIGFATVKAFMKKNMPMDIFIFAWLFFAFWLVINNFESYILYPTGQYINAVILGFIYSYCFKNQSEKLDYV